MTHNQIDFQKYLEDKRHNVAVENETNRYNVVVSEETRRHDLAVEKNQEDANANQKQMNAINAQHYANVDAETNRHNMVQESLQYHTIQETQRSNMANESIGRQNAHSNAINANANLENAQTNRIVGRTTVQQKQNDIEMSKMQQQTARMQAMEQISKNSRDYNVAKQNIGLRERELRQRKREMIVNAFTNIVGTTARAVTEFATK